MGKWGITPTVTFQGEVGRYFPVTLWGVVECDSTRGASRVGGRVGRKSPGKTFKS